jgi:U3 small nucleolar RNA-associated protein 22
LIANSTLAHRNIMSAFDSLTTFLRKNSEQPLSGTGSSALGLPLQIDGVEALSPSLRYSSSFPAIPHPLLGGEGSLGGKVAGVVSSAPIHIQLRFGRSSKWPTDLKAMGAAKTAMLVQIADGIEAMKLKGGCRGFDGPIAVTPTHLTLGYNGYSWRIVVRADPELHLLRGLHKPSEDAVRMLRALTKEHITASSHHATIHGVHTSHPSAGHVVRLLNNWLATHMLSGLVPFEAVELLVAKVYTDNESPLDAPSTIVSGFMRVLQLIATYDWVR